MRRSSSRWEGSAVTFCCSFLCLVPDEAKSSYQVEGTGYDTYLRDAHRQVSSSVHQQQKVLFSEASQCEWTLLCSLRTIVEFAYTGTGGETQSLLRSVTWTFRSSRATSSRFSSTGWAAFLIRSVWSSGHRIGPFPQPQIYSAVSRHANTCLFTMTWMSVVSLYSRFLTFVLLCAAAVWCEPAGDGCSVQAVFVAPPSLERVPPGSIHQLGTRLQVSLLRHRPSKSRLSASIQLLSDPLLLGVVAIL